MANVLICCDEPELTTICGWVLREAGHAVREATVDGLIDALRDDIDVFVTTTAVPAPHPFTIVRQLRPDVRTVLVSTWSSSAAWKAFPSADVVIVGPFKNEELVGAVTARPT